MTKKCIFCEIVNGKIPCYKVYEDKNILAFLDIQPVNPGHTLVIPKKHYKGMESIPIIELQQVILAVKKVGSAIKSSISPKGYNIGLNNGHLSGQIVSHLHFHIMPRRKGDGHHLWKQGEYKEGQADQVLTKIKGKL